MHNKKFIVSSFYKFVQLDNLQNLKKQFKKKIKDFNIKGTFILGHEGINGSFSVISNQFNKTKSILRVLIAPDLKFKTQDNESHSFLRLKIKLKKEIVTMGKEKIDPNLKTGKYLDPDSWEKFIKNKDSIILDTRNSYESEVGTFKSSLKTQTNNFREFPNWIKKNKDKLKNKKIGMFCTGGIRCEKASNYLINLGYKNVFQLNGGIIEYLNRTKNKNKFWDGECFVFDERTTLNDNLEKGHFSQCFACKSAISAEDKKSKFYKSGVSCPKCYDKKSLKQKKRYSERQKQIQIAKNKGIKHLGN